MRKHILVLLLFFGVSGSLLAQRVSYPQLVYRSQAPQIFVDELILPGEEGKTTLAFLFRFNNDFIPFKKIPLNSDLDAPAEAEFYSTIKLNAEVFEGELKRRREPSANSISRDFWSDTLFVNSFEETKSKDQFAAGYLETRLNPGTYNFILQLSMMQEVNERNTQRREITVPDLNSDHSGEVYLLKSVSDKNGQKQLELMNMEDNVPYGEDFYVAVRIPDYESSAEYTLQLNRANISRNDTTARNQVLELDIEDSEVFSNATLKLQNVHHPMLMLEQGEFDHTYLIKMIPASSLENAAYLLSLKKSGQEKPVARSFFQSYWADMPASLYNLDIAIRHLKFILPEKEVDRINKGNDREREQKFREFWEQRDPTPNTVFNELMAEYYRRIDYAFNEFGSQENPMGHESDQGEVYIKFGPPKNKERRFPERGKTLEIWEYPDRTFIFEASSGFGDFKLVGTK